MLPLLLCLATCLASSHANNYWELEESERIFLQSHFYLSFHRSLHTWWLRAAGSHTHKIRSVLRDGHLQRPAGSELWWGDGHHLPTSPKHHSSDSQGKHCPLPRPAGRKDLRALPALLCHSSSQVPLRICYTNPKVILRYIFSNKSSIECHL